MSPLIFLVIVISSCIRNGAALVKCRDPSFSSQLFFDLAQLQPLTVQHRDHIQTPTRCSMDNGTSACAGQLCCGDEVGCCFRDPDSGRQSCGCKDIVDLECSRSAPLAVIKNYVCDEHKMGEISMCFRKVGKGEPSDPSVSAHMDVIKNRNGGLLGGHTITFSPTLEGLGQTLGEQLTLLNGGKITRLLADISTDKLMNYLGTDVLNDLVERVAERKRKGLPYGDPNPRN